MTFAEHAFAACARKGKEVGRRLNKAAWLACCKVHRCWAMCPNPCASAKLRHSATSNTLHNMAKANTVGKAKPA